MSPAAAVALPTPGALTPPIWEDQRFRTPLVLLGFTVLATATFAVLHFALRGGAREEAGARDNRGWKFPEAGYVLCPQGSGLQPTPKEVGVGSIVILALGSPTGHPVEPAWGRVVEVDARDANRVAVVLVGQATPQGQTTFQTNRHGFRLSQKLWVTRDCMWDVLQFLNDPGGVILCGADLSVFDGPDDDLEADGLLPAAMPLSPRELVGRQVELYMVSRVGKGSVWQIPVTAEVEDIGSTGHVATVRVVAFGRNEWAEKPAYAHQLQPGQTFDITWDCVVRYL